MIKNAFNTRKVKWADNCFSWHFIDRKDVSLKMEEIYPGGSSDFHCHARSLQFFFILEGEATIDLGDTRFEMKKHEGIEIPLKKKHRITNSGDKGLLFLLLSCPSIKKNDVLV